MTQQKLVIDLSGNSQKKRAKAFKIASGVSGVESVALKENQTQLEVTGEALDAAKLTVYLRKKLRPCCFTSGNKFVHADLIRMGPVESGQPTNRPNPTIVDGEIVFPNNHYVPSYVYTEVPEPGCTCSIM